MSLKPGEVAFPGDSITAHSTHKNIAVLGPGLRRCEKPNTLVVTKPGIFCHKEPNFYWIDSIQKRYMPKKGDLVVGVIAKKGGDVFKVDIGGAEHASLSVFAFEGATKKQKPDLQVGDIVYARVLSAHREMEPELVCIDKYFKAGKLGQLDNKGFLINVKLDLVYRLLNIENPLLRTLGKKFPYELAVGMNGKVWMNARTNKDVLNLMNALHAAENQSDKDIMDVCRQY